ncbi:hypothetical protein, partial [Enterococcus casseliflavus]|uniref:hypothetical protein n=1 Tax=Enterococcus casseliflavus TaxID=37734 RepID=UPI003D13F848
EQPSRERRTLGDVTRERERVIEVEAFAHLEASRTLLLSHRGDGRREGGEAIEGGGGEDRTRREEQRASRLGPCPWGIVR